MVLEIWDTSIPEIQSWIGAAPISTCVTGLRLAWSGKLPGQRTEQTGCIRYSVDIPWCRYSRFIAEFHSQFSTAQILRMRLPDTEFLVTCPRERSVSRLVRR